MNIDLVSLLFGFQGRINRAKYWIAAVIYVVAMLIGGLTSFVLGFGVPFFVVAGIVYIAMIVSGIAIGIKRLHDRSKSGWWLLVFYLLPGVLSGLGASIGLQTIFGLASLAISIWMIVELGFLRGTPGANQYGPDPLAS
jgi:uncharacterized membrane protein YhaH (DUF805 family)